MTRKTPRSFIYLGALFILLLVATLNVYNLNEAYGDGPPYYARTTNMDKWTDPLPALVAVDAIAVVQIAAILYLTRRKR
ncbi:MULTISPECIES: hypothetical protein [unclassified Caballeronia]|uniref:hypothetical protein n=1 Tax=unclassified Caballeronia TaxID=2646786 RepID=UPI002028E3FA|nr:MULTISPECIES: hypothetical protein [unclassified Caballeronia]MDR5765172.1 hypothetical protein [Caballeronia sp. LZ028]MDR5787355.1 hypothetical protein [Caballeronia sp. LP003]